METIQSKFVICIENSNCDGLTIMKIYQILPDRGAEQDNYLWVVNDSGENRSYPASHFIFVEFPQAIAEKLLSLNSKQSNQSTKNCVTQHWQDNEVEINPWVRFSGMFKDDPLFDEFVEEMAAYRRKIDEEALDNEYLSSLEDYEEKLARGEIQW
ncbi:MAG: hypothetical protein AAGA60_31750 [Cyanobacteria bacterium P01_E01_bin.42]